MTEQTNLIDREHEALLALEQIRAIISAIPPSHPSMAALGEALTLAEGHWHDCQVALAAAQAAAGKDAKHPEDYWAARWRT
ncbi:MAG TPA: hypothetical protein VIL85_24585 [Thermomicrobiales bacterium]|jgi:hypothetical protein